MTIYDEKGRAMVATLMGRPVKEIAEAAKPADVEALVMALGKIMEQDPYVGDELTMPLGEKWHREREQKRQRQSIAGDALIALYRATGTE